MSVPTFAENHIGLSVTREFVEWEMRGESRTVVNAPECFAPLAAALARETEPPHLVCESAGGAERVVVAFLLAARHRVSLAEPEAVCASAALVDAEAITPATLATFASEQPGKLRPATAREYPPSLLRERTPPRKTTLLARTLAAARRLFARRRPPSGSRRGTRQLSLHHPSSTAPSTKA